MVHFIIGMFVGGVVGFFTAVFCVAVKRNDEYFQQ